MAITRLGKGAGGTGTTTATWTGFNIVASDANTVAVVLANWSVSTSAVSTCSVTYGGVSMTQLGTNVGGSGTSRAGCGIYYLFNPGTGAQSIVVTPAGATIAQTRGIDVAFTGVASLGAVQTVATMAHTVTSAVGAYALRVLSNGVTTGTLGGGTTELAAGASVGGVGDFIAVQSAAGAATVAFTASGTATTPLSAGTSLVAAPNAKIETLVDTFATQDNALWTYGANASVSGGQLVGVCNVGYGGGIYSDVAYDLTASSFLVQLVQRANQGNNSTETNFVLGQTQGFFTPNDCVGFAINGTGIGFFQKVGGTYSSSGDMTYNSSTHAWLRLQHSGANVLWDTSTDGISWTNRRSVAAPIAITALYAVLMTGFYGTETTPGSAIWDNLNNPPGAAVQPVQYRYSSQAVHRASLY